MVEQIQPKHILEVGTWNGDRAIEMCQWGARYTGFDLFEDASKETDERERNVKKHHSYDEVWHRLDDMGLDFDLIQGDTRITLSQSNIDADFAFVDGGHSVDTIKSDWTALVGMMEPGSTVVFDDYYIPEVSGFGCNSIVRRIAGWELMKATDQFGGPMIKMVKVKI